MKLKSFTVGLARGIKGAMEKLDQLVEKELGDVQIHDWQDTYYTEEQGKWDSTPGPSIVRA